MNADYETSLWVKLSKKNIKTKFSALLKRVEGILNDNITYYITEIKSQMDEYESKIKKIKISFYLENDKNNLKLLNKIRKKMPMFDVVFGNTSRFEITFHSDVGPITIIREFKEKTEYEQGKNDKEKLMHLNVHILLVLWTIFGIINYVKIKKNYDSDSIKKLAGGDEDEESSLNYYLKNHLSLGYIAFENIKNPISVLFKITKE